MTKKLKQHEIELCAMIPELKETCEKFGWYLGKLGELHIIDNGVMKINTSLIRILEKNV